MKAIQLNGPGGNNQFKALEILAPKPGKGEVLIKTAAYALIPGTDNYAGIAGTIEAVGSGVADFRRGQNVFGIAEAGTCAQFATLRAAQLTQAPANVALVEAAALASPVMIAHIVLKEVSPLRWGQRVLMRHVAGDVAAVVLQLIKASGAHITITSERALFEQLRTLGADRCYYDREGASLEGLADIVLDFSTAGALAEIRFPRLQAALSAEKAVTWQNNNQQRLLFGKALIEDGGIKPQAVQQVSWKNTPALQAAFRKVELGQLILVID